MLLAQVQRVFGVDFSGAKKAGSKIWIAGGEVRKVSVPISLCLPAAALPAGGKSLPVALEALRKYIAGHRHAAFGLDFPFGLPRAFIHEKRWEDFVHAFAGRYPSPDHLWRITHQPAHEKELKRITDEESKTPFAPTNLRLYRQTYFGIRDLLAPLVRHRQACVLPMQKPAGGKPWLIEVCPASSLKALNCYQPYKGQAKEKAQNRKRIVSALEKTGLIAMSATVRAKILEEPEGDALDSVIAAYTVVRALSGAISCRGPWREAYAIEGFVYC